MARTVAAATVERTPPPPPLVRGNDAFIAVQAAMLAIVKGDLDAARQCLKIALKRLS